MGRRGTGNTDDGPRRVVHPRDVLTVLTVITLFGIGLFLLYELRRVIVWLFIAVFAAAVLSPLVAFLVRRGLRRGLAVTVVVVLLVAALGGLVWGFVQPLVEQSQSFAEDLPELVDRVREAPVVKNLLDRFDVESRLSQTSEDLPQRLVGFSGPLLEAFKTLGHLIVATVTIFVLMIFLLLYGPGFYQAGLDHIANRSTRAEVRSIGHDVLRAVSGWVAGNVLTSIVAGISALIVFLILGLDYSVLMSLWVAVADLIPLVGATLGALPGIVVGFIAGPTQGIVVTIFFIAYQQFENHVLQPYVYGRTIQLNPFVVLIALIVGVELAGFLGAMFALPVAGSVQVLINHYLARGANDPDAPLPVEEPA
jgi:predicted PurR-regulated permease PerM